MTPTWQEVIASPEFQALPPEEKEAARQQYFAQVVAPQVPPEDLEVVRKQFDDETAFRELGVTETAGRTIVGAARTAKRMWDGMAIKLADALGFEEDAQRIAEQSLAEQERLRKASEFKPNEDPSLIGSVVGGLASLPIEMAGGMGVQHGFERTADVLDRGGTMEEATKAGLVSGGVRVIQNALPAYIGGRVAERVGGGLMRQFGWGAVTGVGVNVPAEIAGVAAENAALPEGENFADLVQDPFDPQNLAVSTGLSAALGGFGAAGARAAARRKARRDSEKAARQFQDAAEQYGFERTEDADGAEVWRTPSGAFITPEQWENASDRLRRQWVEPADGRPGDGGEPPPEGGGPTEPEIKPPKDLADRLSEIDRLMAEVPEEARPELEAERKRVEKQIEQHVRDEERRRKADELERAALKTTDKGLQAALRKRASKLRGDKKLPEPTVIEGPPPEKKTRPEKIPVPKVIEGMPKDEPPPVENIPVPEARELTPGEAMRVMRGEPKKPKAKKTETDDNQAVLSLIRRAGGINIRLAGEFGERGFNANRGHMAGVFRQNGMDDDRLTELLHQEGYISDDDMEAGNGGRRAYDIVDRLVRKEPVYPVNRMSEAQEARMRRDYEDAILREAEERGIDTHGKDIDDIEGELYFADLARWSRENGVPESALDDATLIARAAELDEAAVERAAIQFEEDTAGFMAEIRRILREHDETVRLAEGREGPAAAAEEGAAEAPTRAAEPAARYAEEVGGQDAAREVADQGGVQGERAPRDQGGQAAEAGRGDRLQRAAQGEEGSAEAPLTPQGSAAEGTTLFPTDTGPGRAQPPQPGQQDLEFPPIDLGELDPGQGRRLMPDEVEIQAASGAVDAKAARAELRSFGQRTRNVTVSKYRAPAGPIDSVEKAAQALAPLRRDTQEQIMAMVTDADGNPLAIIRHAKGGRTTTSVYIDSLAGAIAQVRGGRKVWFAHNHPSGAPEASAMDQRLQQRLESALKGTGMEVQGHIIIAGNKATGFTARDTMGTRDIQPARRSAEIPVQENRFVSRSQETPIKDPKGMREAMARMFEPGETGILITDSALRPVGVLPITPQEMAKLRTGDVNTGAMRVMGAISEVGGTAAIIKTPTGEISGLPARNLANMLSTFDVRVLDITDGNASAAERGSMPFGQEDYYSLSDRPGAPASRAGRPGYARNAEEFVGALRKRFGRKLVDGLIERGVLRVSEGAADPNVPVRARAYTREGEGGGYARMYWDRTRLDDAPGILMHEVGEHYGIIRMLGEDRYRALLNDLAAMRNDPDVREAWDRVARNYRRPDGTPMFEPGSERFMREVAAHLAETQPNLPFVRRLVNEIRAWLYEQFGTTLGRVDAGLIRGLAASALRKAARGELDRMDQPVRMSPTQRAFASRDGASAPSDARVGAMAEQSEGVALSAAGGQVPEQSGVVRVIYRGTNDSGERISGGIAEGTLFAAADEETAKNYAGTGGKIERIGVKQDAKVLVEGSKEFAQVTGRRRGKLIDTLRKGENLKAAADDAAAKARAAGYDALEFTSLKDLGIAIFNEDKFVRDYSPAQQLNQSPAFDGPEVGNTPIGDATEIEVDGVQRPTRNSAGQPIHHTEEGIRNFWRWFGSSRVVDEQGRPLVVYHGVKDADMRVENGAVVFTPKFDVFETKGRTEPGAWFSPDPKVAAKYGTTIPFYLKAVAPAREEGPLTAAPENADAVYRMRGKGDSIAQAWEIAVFRPDQIKLATGNRGTFDPNDGNITYSLSDGRELGEETATELLTRKLFDRFNRVAKAQELAGVVGGEADIAQADRLYHGRVQHLGDTLERDFLQPLGEAMAAAKKVGVTVKDADEFLMALHAPERNRVIAARNPKMPDGGSGLTNAQARRIIESYSPEQRRVLDQIAKIVHRMNDWKLDRMVDGGLITAETRDRLRRQYRYYVPLKTLDEEDAARGIGRGYELRASDIVAAMGRQTKAGSPIAASVMDASRAILRAEKARVDRAIWKFATETDGSQFIRPYDPENPPREVMGRTIGPDGKVKDVVDPNKVQQLTIQLLVDGEPRRVFVPDELLRNQIRKVATTDDPGPVLSAIGRATGLVGRMLTEYNPAFTLPNAVRDAITVGMRAKAHGVSGTKVVAGIPKAWAYIVSNKLDADTEGARFYEEFKEHGGKTGAYGIQDIQDTMRRLERAGAELGYEGQGRGMTRKAFDATLGRVADLVSHANEVVEYASRLALYVELRKKGMSARDAAEAAKEVTVNFNRSGEYGRTLNSVLVFANAALQGLYGTLKYAKNPTVRRNMLAMVALGAATQAWNEWLGGEDENTGEPNINSQSDAVADKNVVLLSGEGRSGIKIPLPPEYAFLYAIGRRLFRAATQGDLAREAGGVVANLLDAALPVRMPDADSSALALGKAVTPTLASPFVDLWTNQNYFGQKIVPEQPYTNAPAPYYTMSYESTSEIAKEVSRLLNAATGGDEIEPGASQRILGPIVAPEGIEHIVGHFTGGLGRFVIQSKDLAKAAAGDKEVDINKVPILNRFVFHDPKGYITRRYKEIGTELEYAEDRIKAGKEVDEKLERALPEYRLVERELRNLRREMKRAAQAGEDVEVYRQEMRALRARVIRAYNGMPLEAEQ